ncbi:MAG: DUF7660 family protein [Blastocatellia bacterium]
MMATLTDQAEAIANRSDLADFMRALADDFRANAGEWSYDDIYGYLEAMAAWVNDMDGYYKNLGKPIPDIPTWGTFGEILLAGSVYE